MAIRRSLYRFRIPIVAASMIGLLAWLVLVAMISGGGKQIFADTPRANREVASAATCARSLLPSQGLNEDDAAERPGLLTIRTAAGLSYLVKLDKKPDNVAIASPALLFFVEGGQAFDTHVPLGEFKLKYAAGNHWCGDADLFGDDTVFSVADDTLAFVRSAASASHVTIELPLQRDGGLIAKRISRNEFYGR